MSILDELQSRCNEVPPRLFRLAVSPKDPGLANASTPRSMFISPNIQRFLESEHELAGAARADIEAFILGRLIVVALKRDHKHCRMARLDKPQEEVWEVRILDADPQLRIFGRFALRDVFVALVGPIDRGDLESDEDFEDVKMDCKRAWTDLFGISYWPITGGSNIDVYISKPVRVV